MDFALPVRQGTLLFPFFVVTLISFLKWLWSVKTMTNGKVAIFETDISESNYPEVRFLSLKKCTLFTRRWDRVLCISTMHGNKPSEKNEGNYSVASHHLYDADIKIILSHRDIYNPVKWWVLYFTRWDALTSLREFYFLF